MNVRQECKVKFAVNKVKYQDHKRIFFDFTIPQGYRRFSLPPNDTKYKVKIR